MFKISSFGDEISQSMEKKLVSNYVEANHGFEKLAKAADFLNAAAEVFEKAGMTKEADAITEVLQKLVKQLNKTSSR